MTRCRSFQSFLSLLRGRVEEAHLPGRPMNPSTPTAKRQPSLAFALEVLEDRLVPSVGNLDLGFGTNGKVLTAVGTGTAQAHAVVIQNDNRIVAAGVASQDSNHDFALLRYNPDGSLDPSFGTGGLVLTDFGLGDDEALAVALQADGKIVVAGSAWNGSDRDLALVRYNADGNLDPTFGTAGKTTFAFRTSSTDLATALAIQADGKIVVAGSADGANQDMAVARFDANGTLDTTFGAGGATLIDFSGGADLAAAVALQTDGKIVLAGQAAQPHGSARNRDFALARLMSDGSLDGSFGTGGKATTDFGFGDDAANSLVIQRSGHIVLAGQMTDGSFDFIGLARYTPSGSLDTSFASGRTTLGPLGTLTTSIGASSDVANALVIQPNDKLVVAGRALIDVAGFPNQDLALARYSADGAVDLTFGINGQVTTPLGLGADVARAVAATSNGKLVVAGAAETGTGTGFGLARYQADIRPIAVDDQSRAASGFFDQIRIPVLGNDFDPDGDLFRVAGLTTPGGIFIPAGQTQQTPEGEFGSDGSVVTFRPIPGFTGNVSVSYTLFDGWLTSTPATITITVVDSTIKKAGDLVPQFGQTGRQLALSPFGDDLSNALAFQADGKVLAAGSFAFGVSDFEVARLNPDGSLDLPYGGLLIGFSDTDFGFGDDVANALVVQPDGKAVVAGFATNGLGNRDFGLVRLDTAGIPDPTFGSLGLVFTDFGGRQDEARGIVVQPDGKLVVVGSTGMGPTQDIALARYHSDGSLDTSFGTGGVVTFNSGFGADVANAVFLQADGKSSWPERSATAAIKISPCSAFWSMANWMPALARAD